MSQKERASHINNLLIWVLILLGIALIVYPTVSNCWNVAHQSTAIAGYEAELSTITQLDYAQFWEELNAYNAKLAQDSESYYITEKSHEEYMRVLNVSPSTGIIAYLEIPTLNVKLPIYHTTDDSILQAGIGHMEGSSLPGGGNNTHTVLSGHSGLPAAKLLTNLKDMQYGDVFYIHVLDKILTYQVKEVITVLPEEMEYLQIFSGHDYCSLMTCTPYGVNSHRLIVRGERMSTVISSETSLQKPQPEVHPMKAAVEALIIPVLFCTTAVVVMIMFSKKRKKTAAIEPRERGE